MQTYYMPVKVIKGRDCIAQNIGDLILGKRAAIITGKGSGIKSGALQQVKEVLDNNGTDYIVFDEIENNPSLEQVYDIGFKTAAADADFIIGIGGGSPLDAAKAVAVFAANGIELYDIFKGSYPVDPLSIVAIPTTAGTGSEVTPYSILTLHKEQTKRSFSSTKVFPKTAFLDAAFTQSLPFEVMAATAIDALSHCIEGYISNRASEISDYIALEGIRIIAGELKALKKGDLDFAARERLLFASMLAGIVISHTGTTIVHSMGYQLTYFKNIPHGKANALLLAEFLSFNSDAASDRVNKVLGLLGFNTPRDFNSYIISLLPNDIKLTEAEITEYVNISINAKNVAFNIKPVTYNDEVEILRRCFNNGI